MLIEENLKRGEEMLTLSRPTGDVQMNTGGTVMWEKDLKWHFKYEYLGVIMHSACHISMFDFTINSCQHNFLRGGTLNLHQSFSPPSCLHHPVEAKLLEEFISLSRKFRQPAESNTRR